MMINELLHIEQGFNGFYGSRHVHVLMNDSVHGRDIRQTT